MRKIKGVIFVIITLFCISSYAQDESSIFIKEFERNYDSLLNSFYMKQNSKVIQSTYSNKPDKIYPSTSAANTPDSVIARRLRALPSSFKLIYNPKVRSIIEYYIDRIGPRVEIMLGLSKYYFPIFEEILDRHNVPHELKYLVVIESALNPNAVSPVGATGLWQFMYSTGKMYDLRVNAVVDDRKDPIKSSVAAARYLKDLYRIYNDWSLALAAYNCGPGNVNKAIRRTGKNDFWEIYDYLPRETRGYVPAYIAAAYVMNYYREHNLSPAKLSKPVATDTVMVAKDIHFEQISSVLNIPVDLIKDLNPQYKQNIIYGTQDKYSLKLPNGVIKYYVSFEDSIANYDKSKYFETEYKKKNYVYKQTSVTHKVRKNETWTSIARRYGVSASDVRKWNKGGKYPTLGKNIVIYKRVAVEQDQDSEQKTPFKEEEIVEEKVDTKVKQQTFRVHTVKKGETLYFISKKYNIDLEKLIRINNINKKRPNLQIGQKIKLN